VSSFEVNRESKQTDFAFFYSADRALLIEILFFVQWSNALRQRPVSVSQFSDSPFVLRQSASLVFHAATGFRSLRHDENNRQQRHTIMIWDLLSTRKPFYLFEVCSSLMTLQSQIIGVK